MFETFPCVALVDITKPGKLDNIQDIPENVEYMLRFITKCITIISAEAEKKREAYSSILFILDKNLP
jgi:hypothetical protein